LAVTVVFALSVTVQTAALTEVQPVHEENVLLPDVEGAVSVTAAPELYVRVKLVVPLVAPPLSAGNTVMATPLEGLAEFTVST
jgi:hypothetical protein